LITATQKLLKSVKTCQLLTEVYWRAVYGG